MIVCSCLMVVVETLLYIHQINCISELNLLITTDFKLDRLLIQLK